MESALHFCSHIQSTNNRVWRFATFPRRYIVDFAQRKPLSWLKGLESGSRQEFLFIRRHRAFADLGTPSNRNLKVLAKLRKGGKSDNNGKNKSRYGHPFSNGSSAARSLPSDDAGSNNNKQKLPIQVRRRGDIPPSWQDLSTPVPEPPNYLLLATGFSLVYLTRQAVASELIQWASLVAILGLTIIRFTQRLIAFLLLKALHLVKVPIAFVMTLAGWSGLLARDIYRLIVNTTSIWPTSEALLLVTLVLSVGEATQATAVSGQPWSFLLASVFGVGAVWGVIHHTIFVLLLLLLTGFSLLVQKKDAVSAVMPATAVLVAIAEPPLKAVALALYLALAVYTHWKAPEQQKESPASSMRMVQPLIMVAAAFFVGLTAGSRYLRSWQILWLAKG